MRGEKNMNKITVIDNLKPLLERKLENLVITHSPNIETDNFLSGDMKKYCFDYPCECHLDGNKLVIIEEKTQESLQFKLSKIDEFKPKVKNDNFTFSQEYVCAFTYGKEIVTFYFD